MPATILQDGLPHSPSPIRAGKRIETLTDLPSVRMLEAAVDCVFAIVSFCAVYRLFHGLAVAAFPFHPLRNIAVEGLVLSFIAVLLLDRSGAYRASGGLLHVRETACILEAATLSMLLFLPCSILLQNLYWSAFVAVEIPLLALLLIVEKHVLHCCLDALHKRGYGLRRVVIYGSGVPAKMLYSALSRSPKLGLLPVAIVENESGRENARVYDDGHRNGRSLLSTSVSLRASFIRAHGAHVVILASQPNSAQQLQSLLEESKQAGATVLFAADSQVAETCSIDIDYLDLDGHLLYGLHKLRPKQAHDLMSRILDIGVSWAMLLLLSPMLLLLYVLVKVDSPGSALFRQIRVGRNGRLFTIYKFRTMYAASCGYGPSPVTSTDPRITRIGRWLRKTSLDELPQLFNIAMGDMAMVGPRPEMPFIVDQYTVEQRQRLSVRPGLTGLWQLSADRCHPIHENLHYDLYYLKHRSVFVDTAILCHTLLFAMHGT